MTQERPQTLIDAPLGRESAYPARYDPTLLFPIERAANRLPLGLETGSLPFVGGDEWWAFEVSWLDLRGKPIVAVARFRLPADSPNLIESKSWKLYLNSFNQTTFSDRDAVVDALERDLGAAAAAPVTAELYGVDDPALMPQPMPGESLDELDVDIDCYTPSPDLLACDENDIVSETLHSHLLKSNCPVTGQPDWGSVLIQYQGSRIDRAALLRYIISYRQHQDFHEHCVEHIFVDLMARCRPEKLLVMARYVRRGGLDINPWRATPGWQPSLPPRLLRQ
ncbi:NADPH-dependent 7-cyano-7-deazaguanine reductase QueF [Salinicola rhizosphaerae]|uniref:NADPH-dependent 7-cyano-7-deazaguanine reductase n=1 Tax=Salinicola rhizosphaerae TaxID=1443141 RepID=A0ABQ3E981_9GAMM|nr:NADPH-dependent 7-cyano-7-deazaguanine reductase QueF [Salinicola rhizosphaerae]GHB27458.1 NADPH-dependent 7-cyano-7-deazaguanine reductase [Salinicola rhizosphaerae]